MTTIRMCEENTSKVVYSTGLSVSVSKSMSDGKQKDKNHGKYLEVYGLANIKSAKKRILVNKTKMERNKAIKSGVKTAMKKVEAAVVAKDTAAAQAALLNATSVIDKAATKGVYHKNNAARKVSRLTKAVNSIQ